MRRLILHQFTFCLCLAFAFVLQADTLINNFDSGQDYVASGIVGDTNWDGVYLGFGDIPVAPNEGGNGQGVTEVASEAFGPFSGFLSLQSRGTDWSGGENDGFFLYKVVKGDFDMSVENVPGTLTGGFAYDNRGFHFAGLMVRAYHTNDSGAPFSTTDTNAVENSLRLWRFNEFGIDSQIRHSTNNANIENLMFGSDSETNSSRFFRITRTGDTLQFYVKTNSFDSWFLITNASAGAGYVATNGSVTRDDWAGIPLQVGIAQAAFSGDTRDAIFDNFELSGTNVTFPTLPAAPTGLVVSDVNSTTVDVSWTANGGDGSIVVVRANDNIIAQPINGFTYGADTNYETGDTLLGADGNKVVYVGTGSSVQVTGLGGSNNTYQVAVFSYSGTGSSTVYNTANPASDTVIGPGRVSEVSFTLAPSSIPRGGAALGAVTATYDSGDSYDVSDDPSTLWNSSNPSVATAGNGVISGITNGTTDISISYAGVGFTNSVSVVDPSFTDDFSSAHDYLATGVPGSMWDGLYSAPGDVPASDEGGNTVSTTVADAGITTNNMLTVSAAGTSWEGPQNDGFFLFKNVTGDFQAVVHADITAHGAWQFSGLMARGAEANGGALGGSEDTVANWLFDQFSVLTSSRQTIDGAYQGANDFNDTTPLNTRWLLLQRVNGTNFYCYNKATAGEPWTLPANGRLIQPNLGSGVPVQVGLAQSMYTANESEVRFGSFMLHGDGLGAGTPAGPPSDLSMVLDSGNNTMVLSWNAGSGSDGSLVLMRASSTVNASPAAGVTYTGDASFGSGDEIGNGNFAVYVGTNTTVTVSNLSGGLTYHAAVYSSAGSGASTAYNTQASAVTSEFFGVLESVTLSVPSTAVPSGGVGRATVTGVFSGFPLDVTDQAVISSDDTNVVVLSTNSVGVLNGRSAGSTTVVASLLGFTNSQPVTVMLPGTTDDFNTAHNYLTTDVVGTIWDGLYLGDAVNHPANSIPGGNNGGDSGNTFVCDANTTSNGVLTVQATATTWVNNDDDGFFLWKYVPGDFQVAVQIVDKEEIDFQFAGLLARAFGTNGSPTNPTGTNAVENWVYSGTLQQFNVLLDARDATDGADAERVIFQENTNTVWLLMTRESGTNFHFFHKNSAAETWAYEPTVTIVRPDLAGVPLQVGVFQAMYSVSTGTAWFDDFSLTYDPGVLSISDEGASVKLEWVGGGSSLEQTVEVGSSASWGPVGGSPTFLDGVYSQSVPKTNATMYFRLSN